MDEFSVDYNILAHKTVAVNGRTLYTLSFGAPASDRKPYISVSSLNEQRMDSFDCLASFGFLLPLLNGLPYRPWIEIPTPIDGDSFSLG